MNEQSVQPGAKRRSGITRNVVVATVLWIGLVGTWEWLAPPHDSSVTLCMFKRCTGIPCPTCGSTGAVKALFRGDLIQAFVSNPLLIIVSALIIVGMIASVAAGRERTSAFMSRNYRTIPAMLIVGLLLNWVYLLVKEFRH